MLNQLSTELPFPVGAPALAAEEEGEGQINTMVMKCVRALSARALRFSSWRLLKPRRRSELTDHSRESKKEKGAQRANKPLTGLLFGSLACVHSLTVVILVWSNRSQSD